MKILVVGAGIAGPTLVYWALCSGHEPVLVERAPSLRRGGYLIDFWGAGFDVAERMGIAPELARRGYRIHEARQVDAAGRCIASFDPERLVAGVGGRYVSLPRGELAAAIYGALDGRVETLFGDTVCAIDDDGDRVRVSFERGGIRDFDLVVGADGAHSRVRQLVFGAEEQFEKQLGITVAAFDVAGYRPRDERTVVMYTDVGFQVTRVATRDDVTMFLFTFGDDGRAALATEDEQKRFLRARLAHAGWETQSILEQMEGSTTFYFDRASQICMPSWTRGRVALIGDAAASVSLLAGQGSALAMVEAYVLAAELSRSKGHHLEAFARYEQLLGAFLRSKQKAAIGLAPAFAPKNRLQLLLRNSVVKLLSLPFVAKRAMGKSLQDAIELPPAPCA
jgi:2-polyprenyl-6-methoxyphenol hydroxylase-like FAD-dependent oxidoreductase